MTLPFGSAQFHSFFARKYSFARVETLHPVAASPYFGELALSFFGEEDLLSLPVGVQGSPVILCFGFSVFRGESGQADASTGLCGLVLALAGLDLLPVGIARLRPLLVWLAHFMNRQSKQRQDVG